MASGSSGWNLWVWLECIYMYNIDILIIIPIPLVLLFFGSSIPTSLFIFKMFFRSCLLFLCNIAQRTFEMVQKSRSRE